MLSAAMSDVLFICTGNYYRSRFAEAVFNHHAERSGVAARAFSRGLMTYLVDGDLSPLTARALAERSIPLHRTSHRPTQLTAGDFLRARKIVALHDEEHRPMLLDRYPEYVPRVTFWGVSDLPVPAEVALPQIEGNVLELLATL